MRRHATPIRSTLAVIARPHGSRNPLKIILCLLLMLMLAGCIPIGVRMSNLYAQAPQSAQPT